MEGKQYFTESENILVTADERSFDGSFVGHA